MKLTIEPIFVPYCSHTPAEMVGILRSIYQKKNGDLYNFSRTILKSPDPRLYAMNHFAINVMHEFCKTIDKEK